MTIRNCAGASVSVCAYFMQSLDMFLEGEIYFAVDLDSYRYIF